MNAPLTVGSLFSGIGGFDLGLERAGMRTVWFCEQDPYCQRVLARHWPGVPVHPDVRALVADTARVPATGVRAAAGTVGERTRASGEPSGEGRSLPVPVPYVDVLCGGFPCQDISIAGKGAGIDGERSGLWGEYARLIRELRPRYVIVENVSALLARGMDRVLRDLAACGYDAEWDCIPASAVGAPHRRDRVWLVAYPQDQRRQRPLSTGGPGGQPARSAGHGSADHRTMGNPDRVAGTTPIAGGGGCGTLARPGTLQRTVGSGSSLGDHWSVESRVGRVAHGVPNRVDRLRALGNALVPQVAEWIGQRILEWEGNLT